MARRRFPIKTGKFYHTFNRSNNKERIFVGRYKRRFYETLQYYRHDADVKFSDYIRFSTKRKQKLLKVFRPKIHIFAWAIMPTHFHIGAKVTVKGAYSRFMKRAQTSFARYYNKIKERHGHVFAEQYKAIPIRSSLDIITVADYIHLNPVRGGIRTIDNIHEYKFTSLYYFFKKNRAQFTKSSIVLDHFDNDAAVYLDHLRSTELPDPER